MSEKMNTQENTSEHENGTGDVEHMGQYFLNSKRQLVQSTIFRIIYRGS